MSIRERLHNVQKAIGERPVTLVAVTKYAPVDRMREAYEAGIRHFGENRVQDALAKMALFPPATYPDLHWHLIGPLQSNKINKTLGRFHLIHAIDSTRVLEKLSRANQAAGRVQAVLLQVNFSADETRHGFLPREMDDAVTFARSLPGIALQGLMTMAPPVDDPAVLRRVFCDLAGMRGTLAEKHGIDLPELSMGMSHDYVHALNCGATIIRIGNYLFREESVGAR